MSKKLANILADEGLVSSSASRTANAEIMQLVEQWAKRMKESGRVDEVEMSGEDIYTSFRGRNLDYEASWERDEAGGAADEAGKRYEKAFWQALSRHKDQISRVSIDYGEKGWYEVYVTLK
jgi:hypothetical protein